MDFNTILFSDYTFNVIKMHGILQELADKIDQYDDWESYPVQVLRLRRENEDDFFICLSIFRSSITVNEVYKGSQRLRVGEE